jgi:ketosteroid isomerase-like protein
MTRTEGLQGLVGPDELTARFARCVETGDLDGIMQLYAADAVVSLRDGREAAGTARVRAAFAAALASGQDLAVEPAGPAVVTGALACTTSATADGRLCTQVARQEADGTWRWVRDGFRLRDLVCAGDGQVQPLPAADGRLDLAEVA